TVSGASFFRFFVSGRAQWIQLLGHSSVMDIVTWSGIIFPRMEKNWLFTRRSKPGLGTEGIQVEQMSLSASVFTGFSPSKSERYFSRLFLIRTDAAPLIFILMYPSSISV